MIDAKELRGKLKGLRARAAELEVAVAAAPEAEKRGLRFALAEVREEIVDCGAELREMMPRHRVSYRQGGGELGIARKQFLDWREQDQSGDDESPTDRDVAVTALKRAQLTASTSEKGDLYAAAKAEGLSITAIASRYGVDKSTVSRCLIRRNRAVTTKAQSYFARMKQALADGMDLKSGQTIIRALVLEMEADSPRKAAEKPPAAELHALAMESMDENGAACLDLSNPEALKIVMKRLSTTQALYMYLYYGEWLSLREIRDLIHVDKSSVLRCIRRGLERMSADLGAMPFRIEGLDSMEDLLMAHFNELDPEDVVKRKRKQGACAHCAAGTGTGGGRVPMSEEERCLSEEIVQGVGPKDGRCGSGKLLVFLAELTADLEVYLGRTARSEERGRMIRRVLAALMRKVCRALKKVTNGASGKAGENV